MDPLSALSVAASIVQFVGFTSTVVSRIYEAVRSRRGELRQHGELKDETHKLLALSNDVERILRPEVLRRPLTPVETALEDVCKECHNKAMDLMELLTELELKPQEDGEDLGSKLNQGGEAQPSKPRIKWKDVQQAVKAIWRQQDIGALQQRLSDARERLMLTILVSLR